MDRERERERERIACPPAMHATTIDETPAVWIHSVGVELGARSFIASAIAT